MTNYLKCDLQKHGTLLLSAYISYYKIYCIITNYKDAENAIKKPSKHNNYTMIAKKGHSKTVSYKITKYR